MSDMACIYEMNTLEENEQLDQDFLAGRGLDVLFCLMDGADKAADIAKKLGMPIYSTQLYLKRLIKAGLINEKRERIINGQIEKSYQLASDEIEIINQIQGDTDSEAAKKRQADIAAQHFSIMVRNAIRHASEEQDKPSKAKAYFMKAQKQDMQKFREDLDHVFCKYQSLEQTQAEDTYSLFTVLAPYKMEG